MEINFFHQSLKQGKRILFSLVIIGAISLVSYNLLTPTGISRSPSETLVKELEYQNFLSTYSKFYLSDNEYEARFKIFQENTELIRKHNQAAQDWVLGINEFSDMTSEEFKNLFLLNSLGRTPKFSSVQINPDQVPNTINWVSAGAVTPVKTQGNCGSHWAFSAVGAVEGVWKIAGHPLIELSVQQVIDCSEDQGNEGCNGGFMDYAFDYLISNNGITSEAIYPYVANDDGDCQPSSINRTVASISSYVNVQANSSAALLAAIAKQPVSVAVEADLLIWQHYQGGVVSRNCGTLLDHGALAVGYDLTSNPPYYLVKNSWGASWGEKGYIKLAVIDGPGVCGIQIEPSYPVV